MNLKRFMTLGVILTLIITLMVGCTSQGTKGPENNDGVAEGEKVKIRFGSIYNETTTHGQAIEKFKKDIEEKSKGNITVEIFHGGLLGSEKDHAQAQKEDSLEMLYSGTAGVGLYVPATSVFESWYAFSSIQDIQAAVSNLYEDIDSALQSEGFKLLGAYYDGPREILSNKKVTNLQDLKKLKLRAPGAPIYVNSITALGAQAISMPLGDVYTSLQTGGIDAMEGTIDTIYGQKFYEVCKYVIQDAHVFQPLFITYNNEAWNRLSSSTQELILQVAQDSSDYQVKLHLENMQKDIDAIKDSGVEFIEITDRELWIDAVDEDTRKFAEENGELGLKIYEELKKY